eukprot:scaffold126334_cov29-Prasinocladus_malaysianus.AAC.1
MGDKGGSPVLAGPVSLLVLGGEPSCVQKVLKLALQLGHLIPGSMVNTAVRPSEHASFNLTYAGQQSKIRSQPASFY